MRELLKGGLLHEDVNTVAGYGAASLYQQPWLNNGELDWRDGASASLDPQVIAAPSNSRSHATAARKC